MFFTAPKCPGDDGRAESIAKADIPKERGIEFPPPYIRQKKHTTRFDLHAQHEKICRLFYIEGFTYSEIADELGDGVGARSVRAYITKCEAEFDLSRRK